MKNKNEIEIKACCASCQHRVINNDGRVCSQIHELVESGHVCSMWKMHRQLQNAGNGGGLVKKWNYLKFYMEKWLHQRRALETGQITADELLSTSQIHQQYNEQYGSEFIKI